MTHHTFYDVVSPVLANDSWLTCVLLLLNSLQEAVFENSIHRTNGESEETAQPNAKFGVVVSFVISAAFHCPSDACSVP